MNFIVGLLTAVLVLNCLVLILLVLIQLPKKDAGAGMAFGSGTADALFGSGSGNVLTKITKYLAGGLVFLALLLSYLHDNAHHDTDADDFKRQVLQKQMQASGPAMAPKSAAPASTVPAAAPTVTPITPVTAPALTNAPASK